MTSKTIHSLTRGPQDGLRGVTADASLRATQKWRAIASMDECSRLENACIVPQERLDTVVERLG